MTGATATRIFYISVISLGGCGPYDVGGFMWRVRRSVKETSPAIPQQLKRTVCVFLAVEMIRCHGNILTEKGLQIENSMKNVLRDLHLFPFL